MGYLIRQQVKYLFPGKSRGRGKPKRRGEELFRTILIYIRVFEGKGSNTEGKHEKKMEKRKMLIEHEKYIWILKGT